MQYTFIYDNQSYDIPKFTSAVKDKILAVNAANAKQPDGQMDWKKTYDFIKELIGVEKATELFGSDKFDDIDLNDIRVAYFRIVQSYDKPYQEEQTAQSISSRVSAEDRELLVEMLKNGESLTKMIRAYKN